MKIKRMISAVLVSSLALSLAASCGIRQTVEVDDNGNKTYIYKFNMYTQNENEYPTGETFYDKFLKEKFHLKFDYDRIPRTDWETKTNTYFAVGSEPDVTIGGKQPNYNTWAKDMYLAPIDVSKLPNWCKLWDGVEGGVDTVVSLASAADGNLYYLPTVRQEKVQMCWDYRKDIFDEMGLEFPQTADEFYEVAKKLKEKYPSAVIVSSNGQKEGAALTGFFQMFWIPELILQTESCVDPVTGEFVPYALTTDNAREMYKFIHKLYKEGLIDKQIMSVEKEGFTKLNSESKVFLTYNYVYNIKDFTKKSEGGKWAWSPDMITAYPDKGTIYKKDPTFSNWGPAFSAKLAQDPERFDAILAYYDWCATPEGQLFTTYGVDKEMADKYGIEPSYEMVNGEPEVLDGWYHEVSNTKGTKVSEKYGTIMNTFIKHPKRFQEARGEEIDKLWDAFMEHDKYYAFPEFAMRYTDDEEDDYTDIVTSLDSKRDEYMARFFMGESDPNNDNDWNQYINDMKKVGLDKFCELQTRVYERTKAEVDAKAKTQASTDSKD